MKNIKRLGASQNDFHLSLKYTVLFHTLWIVSLYTYTYLFLKGNPWISFFFHFLCFVIFPFLEKSLIYLLTHCILHCTAFFRHSLWGIHRIFWKRKRIDGLSVYNHKKMFRKCRYDVFLIVKYTTCELIYIGLYIVRHLLDRDFLFSSFIGEGAWDLTAWHHFLFEAFCFNLIIFYSSIKTTIKQNYLNVRSKNGYICRRLWAF